jgi:predicted transcriptional regulator
MSTDIPTLPSKPKQHTIRAILAVLHGGSQVGTQRIADQMNLVHADVLAICQALYRQGELIQIRRYPDEHGTLMTYWQITPKGERHFQLLIKEIQQAQESSVQTDTNTGPTSNPEEDPNDVEAQQPPLQDQFRVLNEISKREQTYITDLVRLVDRDLDSSDRVYKAMDALYTKEYVTVTGGVGWYSITSEGVDALERYSLENGYIRPDDEETNVPMTPDLGLSLGEERSILELFPTEGTGEAISINRIASCLREDRRRLGVQALASILKHWNGSEHEMVWPLDDGNTHWYISHGGLVRLRELRTMPMLTVTTDPVGEEPEDPWAEMFPNRSREEINLVYLILTYLEDGKKVTPEQLFAEFLPQPRNPDAQDALITLLASMLNTTSGPLVQFSRRGDEPGIWEIHPNYTTLLPIILSWLSVQTEEEEMSPEDLEDLEAKEHEDQISTQQMIPELPSAWDNEVLRYYVHCKGMPSDEPVTFLADNYTMQQYTVTFTLEGQLTGLVMTGELIALTTEKPKD